MSETANWQTQAAWHYHRVTSHSWESIQRSPHRLDWDNYPLPFKIYEGLPAEPLPTDWETSRTPALAAVLHDGNSWQRGVRLDRRALARLLFFSAGVVRVRQYGELTIAYRAAACTGNLHHIDLYLVCGRLPDLEAGLYHFGPHDFALRQLRSGDFRRYVLEAAGQVPALANSPVLIVCTSTFWRNAWKYRERAYRHAYWDCGTLLANLFALAAATGLRYELVLGFIDSAINRLLAVDPRQEAALAIVGLGHQESEPPPSPSLAPLHPKVQPVSRKEIEFPEITRMHAASSLEMAADVERWQQAARTGPIPTPRVTPAAAANLLPELPRMPADPIEAVILRRGSTRRFSRDAISPQAWNAVLRAATTRIPADFQQRIPLTDPYLIIHAVEGVATGVYFLQRAPLAVHSLRSGSFRTVAGQLALGQVLAADAALNVYHLADLHRILPAFGNRGYRAAQLEGGIAGGKIYLAAFSMGIGATGLTFFDDDVVQFFSPHAAGKSVTFLTAAGAPYRKKQRSA